MTRQELTDAVAEVLGIHATEWRIDTIVRLADMFAASQVAADRTPPGGPPCTAS